MDAPALERAWSIAGDLLSGVDASSVLDALDPRVRELLVEYAGDPVAAAELMRVHAGEALVAERLVRREVGPDAARALGPEDPAALLLRSAPRPALRKAARAIDVALGQLSPPPEDLWPRSFSPRAQKRRGGVYTEPELVDLLLDLAGWKGQGRFLEPAAGAGAFLVRAYQRALEAGEEPTDLAARLAGNDLHPFACRAARTSLALSAPQPGALPRVSQADALLGPRAAPTEQEGAWEFVLGNPPYVRGERIPAGVRARYKERYGRLGPGNVDLASYFVQRALRWLVPGGKLGFVVTQGLFEARSAAGLRALLAEHTVDALVTLEWAPPQFAEATVVPCLLVVTNAPPPARHRVALGRATAGEEGGLRVSWTHVRQDSWLALGRGPWPLVLERGDLGWLRQLRAEPTPLVAGYGLAVRTRVGAGKLIADGPAPPGFTNPRRLIDGREVRAWCIDYGGRTIDYRPEAISDAKSEAFFACPKVLVPRIALTPQAAVDEGEGGPFFARNTVMVVRAPGTPLDGSPHALAALINSLPVRAYAFHLLRAGVLAGSHRATFYSNMIGAFPVPQRLLEEPALLRRLARLGRRARDLARGGRGEALAQLEATIDELVAEAFDLTAAQLAGLEGRAAREPLRSILDPLPAGARTRKIGVAEYAAGARYR